MRPCNRAIKSAISLSAVLFCFAVTKGADAQRLPTRLVIDTRAVCHDLPAEKSASQPAKLFGTNIVTTRNLDADGALWYYADQHSVRNRACWVYGPYTTESGPHSALSGRYTNQEAIRDMEADWLAVLDHLLARNDVSSEEYVDVDNRMPASTPRLQFRRLQMLHQAASVAVRDDQLYSSSLKLAWLTSHVEKDPFGGDWYVSPRKYRDVFDANRDATWARKLPELRNRSIYPEMNASQIAC